MTPLYHFVTINNIVHFVFPNIIKSTSFGHFYYLVHVEPYIIHFQFSAPTMPLFHGNSGTPYSTRQQNSPTASFHHGHYLVILNNNSLGAKLWHEMYCINEKY